MPMLTPDEYRRYSSFKAISEFGRELDEAGFREARKARFRSWLPEMLAPYEKICDYGSGSGWLKELCGDLGKSCVEVDDIGGGKGLETIEPVDLVVAICVIEHMTPEEVIQFVETAARKGRALFISTNNPKCLFSHFVLWDDLTHVRLYSEHSIGALLRTKGYAIERTFYQDDVLTAYGVIGSRLEEYRRVVDAMGPMMLSSPYNYWCMLATAPRSSALA